VAKKLQKDTKVQTYIYEKTVNQFQDLTGPNMGSLAGQPEGISKNLGAKLGSRFLPELCGAFFLKTPDPCFKVPEAAALIRHLHRSRERLLLNNMKVKECRSMLQRSPGCELMFLVGSLPKLPWRR
jgi:hypothetical protein